MRRILLATLFTATLPLPWTVHAADATRQVAPFIAVNARGAFAMTVEAGKAQSVRVSGDDAFVNALETRVVDNELEITVSGKLPRSGSSNAHVTITLPSLSRVKVEGAGETIITGVASDRLDIGYQGAGRLTASGKVQYLRLNARGVGEVDTKGLHAERVDVNFSGVGDVKVYASDTVNAVAKGMGSLTYYGKPKTVNKSASGIGSVSAGD
ncbi:hypothetical protein ASF61_12745 [Duganella sp. Leaf126]|uniref:head GIN domain-containing protein n=1 Tax=Duganella sp. Leaf126 TaxID=1736266 RepID=UPI0006FB4B39|nr:head GIN domain-containing protein [Duganella sp. Leaf126]KQQ32955.1 hypothetical protein ASF61_12745 [Duganella sp. Leaf126]